MRKTTKSSFLAKLGKAGMKAHEAHKSDETVFDTGSDLPAGIENGIARLSKCYFKQSKDDADKYFYYAEGIVVEPDEKDHLKIRGCRTSIIEPIYETPGRKRVSIEDHLGWVYNELRKLGVDTTAMEYNDLETVVAALQLAKPYFRFRTWIGTATPEFPNPRVNHVWKGICEYEGEDLEDEYVDEDEPDDDSKEVSEDLTELGELADNGDEEAQLKLASIAESNGIDSEDEKYTTWSLLAEDLLALSDEQEEEDEGEEDSEDEEEAEEEEESDEVDDEWLELGVAADEGDEEAQHALVQACVDADPDDFETWSDLAKYLVESSEEDSDESDEEEADEEDGEEEAYPEEGEIYFYKPKGKRKKVEVEVTKVYTGKQTCTLKDLQTNTTYRGVSWDSLLE